MRRLKRKARALSDFEKEIRNPGAALKEVITEIRENGLRADDMRNEINEAILKDCGWSQKDLNEHFDLYSDWYKEIYRMRPDSGEYLDAIQYMIDYGESECDYVDISSLSEDEKDFKDYDDYDEYEEEKDDDDTLDNVTLNGEPVTDKEVKERLLN